ncbi:MAG: glycosyltransferase family 25 protein [Pseudomonadota bacterium]
MADTLQLPIFVITLEDCTDRQATISRSLGDLGLAFEFIPAVDGRRGLPEDALAQVNKAAGAAKLGRPITDAECAASLSHASVYSRIVEGGLDHALIFEDDAIITPGVGKFVEAQGYRSADMVILNHLNARVMKGGAKVLFDHVHARPLAVPCFRAAAYSLSNKGAAWLLDKALPIASPPDWPADITQIGAVALEPEIVHHPPETPGQSTLAPGRGTKTAKQWGRFLDPAYARRVWRKAQSERIS